MSDCSRDVTLDEINQLFWPRSVAVVGASNDPTKAGHHILKTMVNNPFKGRLYAVNPAETSILGCPCHPSLRDVPDNVDLVVISVPASRTLDAMRDAAAKGGIRGAVLVAAGFAETADPEMVELQRRVVDMARGAGMRVIGPNCNGLINTANGLSTAFPPGVRMTRGNIGIISQSGALGGSVLMLMGDQPEPMGYARWAHVGNMADVTNLQLLELYAEAPDVEVIGMYVEGVPDGRRLISVAELATRRKPVLMLKVGRTEVGAKATLSHTGALAGSDRVYDAALAQCGIVRVDGIAELVDSMKVLSMGYRPNGNRLCILTEAGGPGIIAMDELGLHSGVLTPAVLTDASKKRLREILPGMAVVCKPEGYIDMTAAALEKEHGLALEAVLNDPGVDSVIVISLPPTFLPAMPVAEHIVEAKKRAGTDKMVGVCFMRGAWMLEARALLEKNGIPTFDSPDMAVRAVARATLAAAALRRPREAVVSVPPVRRDPVIAEARDKRRPLLEHEAAALLARNGIECVKAGLARSPHEAEEIASSIGYPVVLKVASPDIPHKTDVGGVVLGLSDGPAVRAAYESIVSGAASKAPGATVVGTLVAKQLSGGLEVIAGAVRDREFGPIVMFGLGGILVEVLKDVAFRVAPFDVDEARRMIAEIRGYPLLTGARGRKPADLDSIAGLLVKLGNLLLQYPEISEVDLNPVMVFEKGLSVVDARITLVKDQ